MHQAGYLVVYDITGYTSYLTGTEQLHAEGILQDLLKILLENTVSPLVVNKLEGDAVLAFTPPNSFTEGQSLMELVENIYVKFRNARDNMHRHTSCSCSACRSIAGLDLKFFVHYGSYSLLNIGGREELSGPNVILIHRLMKNQVTTTAYSLYTQAAVDALQMNDYCSVNMTLHTEQYEHLGEVRTYVQDLHGVLEHYRDANRVCVSEEDAQGIDPIEVTTSAPLSMIWEYVSQPKTFPEWHTGIERTRMTGMDNERNTLGTIGHCAHGKQTSTGEIVDLRPFEYVTYKSLIPVSGMGSMLMNMTYVVEGGHEGTKLVMRTSEIEASGNKFQVFMQKMLFKIMGPKMKEQLKSSYTNGIHNLCELVEQQVKNGTVVPAAPASISDDDINETVQAFIADNA